MTVSKSEKHIEKSLLVFLLVFFCSCNFHIDKVSTPIDVAKDMSRSKELGLFINEFAPNKVIINDTLQFEIVSAWVEYNCYTSDIEDKYKAIENWTERKQWKLKQDFNPLNKGHLSFLVKGNFKDQFKAYGEHWQFHYCQLIETKDTSISNNYTYFETYGPDSYDSLTSEINLRFEYYIPSMDTTKYGNWRKFGEFIMTRNKNYPQQQNTRKPGAETRIK